MKKGRSLHIGINIPSLKMASHGNEELVAAENDALSMANIARNNGFAETTLLGMNATRYRVEEVIRSASQNLNPGDTFLFTASTHGTFRPDKDGDEPSSDDSGTCFFDAPIYDDEFSELWKCFQKDIDIVMILDCCFNGTGSDLDARGVKFLPSESTYPAYNDYMREYGPIRTCKKTNVEARVLLISASQDPGNFGEKCYDATSDGERNSKFTQALLDTLGNGAFKGNYYDLYTRIRDIVSKNPYPGPMNPNYHSRRAADEPYWLTRTAFSINPQSVPLTSTGTTMNLYDLTIKLTTTIDGKTTPAIGAIVLVIDMNNRIRSVGFIGKLGAWLCSIPSGTYTVLSIMNYTMNGLPIETYRADQVTVEQTMMVTFDLGGHGPKGDIKALVKIGGQPKSDIQAVLTPGNVIATTGDDGIFDIGFLYGGPYCVTVSYAGQDQPQCNINVPSSGTVTLPPFQF